jgi:hypothetical protein
MMKPYFFVCFLSLMTVVPWSNALADSFNCDGGIVSTGDGNFDVLAKCGPPDFKDSHQEEVVQRFGGTWQRVYVTVDEWTYNLGPTQFTRIVVLKNGRISEIRLGQYGYIKP